MPSAAPDVWRRDIEWTRQRLPAGKILSVSVVGTVQNGWSMSDLAEDYAKCAAWAAQCGADCIEVNLSCPNVTTCDGQLYQIPEDAAVVVRKVREAIGNFPMLVKIGHITSPDEASSLLDTVEPWINGLAMTNSVATTMTTRDGFAFDGQRRGICGEAIRRASLAQVQMFSDLIRVRGSRLTVVACGGANSGEHVGQYLQSGASAVHIATAAMIDPQMAIQIKRTQFLEIPARH
jgi:dihydroorotate dehydrogenase